MKEYFRFRDHSEVRLSLSCPYTLLGVKEKEEEHICGVTPRENSPCISINDVKGQLDE